MKMICELQELEKFDSDVKYPHEDLTLEMISKQEEVVKGILKELSIKVGIDYQAEGSEVFQDGACFMCAQEYRFDDGISKNDVLSGIYFSKFSGLVTAERFSKKSKIGDEKWKKVLDALSEDYELNFIKPSILKEPYGGLLESEGKTDWFWRFFSAWY